jgi:hypothetical protein
MGSCWLREEISLHSLDRNLFRKRGKNRGNTKKLWKKGIRSSSVAATEKHWFLKMERDSQVNCW